MTNSQGLRERLESLCSHACGDREHKNRWAITCLTGSQAGAKRRRAGWKVIRLILSPNQPCFLKTPAAGGLFTCETISPSWELTLFRTVFNTRTCARLLSTIPHKACVAASLT